MLDTGHPLRQIDSKLFKTTPPQPSRAPAVPFVVAMIIAVIQDGLRRKGKGMFPVCGANAGNILSHGGTGSISGE